MEIKTSQDRVDKFEWRCMNYCCRKYQTTLNLRKDSCLYNFKVDFSKLLQVIYYVSKDIPNFEIREVMDVKKDTLYKIRALIHDKISSFFVLNPIRLGGPGAMIQIDEKKMNYNVRNHRGLSIRPIWAFCIVDTSYKPALKYFTLVEDRTV
jgi:hypothetical protein